MDEEIRKIEAVFGAISKIAAGDEPDTELTDARCPKCGASSFARVSDLHTESVVRLEVHPEESNVERVAGLSDLDIVRKFKPPRRKSAVTRVLLVGIPLGAGAYYVYRRFGDSLGQLAIVV